jgi:hypothetical protein
MMQAFKHGKLHMECGVMLQKLITRKKDRTGQIGLTLGLPP